jgi:hypothetical protein
VAAYVGSHPTDFYDRLLLRRDHRSPGWANVCPVQPYIQCYTRGAGIGTGKGELVDRRVAPSCGADAVATTEVDGAAFGCVFEWACTWTAYYGKSTPVSQISKVSWISKIGIKGGESYSIQTSICGQGTDPSVIKFVFDCEHASATVGSTYPCAGTCTYPCAHPCAYRCSADCTSCTNYTDSSPPFTNQAHSYQHSHSHCVTPIPTSTTSIGSPNARRRPLPSRCLHRPPGHPQSPTRGRHQGRGRHDALEA